MAEDTTRITLKKDKATGIVQLDVTDIQGVAFNIGLSQNPLAKKA